MLKTTWRECDMRKLEGENFRSILNVIKETVIKKPFLNIFLYTSKEFALFKWTPLISLNSNRNIELTELRVVLHSKYSYRLCFELVRGFLFLVVAWLRLTFILINFPLAVLPALVPTGFEDDIWFVGEYSSFTDHCRLNYMKPRDLCADWWGYVCRGSRNHR